MAHIFNKYDILNAVSSSYEHHIHELHIHDKMNDNIDQIAKLDHIRFLISFLILCVTTV